ncbi:MAG TPA: universal stress protein [Candidatus Kapabacteria bacterium]|nr:universal stress protein [Candidatus Kapabacteria bacterium]
MRIICGTDFSIHADAAVLAAATLAARLELPLTLVHVINPGHYIDPSHDLLGQLRSTRRKKLQVLAERAGRRGAIVETVILEGPPAVKLSEFASNVDARFLVVSAIGQIAPTRWLTGSVTDQTVQMSSIPTLVIRDPGSFETWLHGERRLTVMVGYDFSTSSDAAIRWIASLDAIAPCDITIAYVASPARERARLGIAAPLTPLSYPSALRKFLEEEIEEKTGPVLGRKAHIRVKADWGRPDSQLIEMAADARTDLMVAGTSQRRGLERLGSVARAVLHYYQKNVASVPEGWVAPASPILPEWNNLVSTRAEWVSESPENKYATAQR